MNERDEHSLIQESRKGSLEAFGALVNKFSYIVYRFAYRLMNNVADAEDLSQEVFLHAFRGIKKFEERSSFSTWLYRITVNLWKNKLKNESQKGMTFSLTDLEEPGEEKNVELPDTSASLEEIVDKNVKIEIIKQCLEIIHPLYKAIIVLRDVEGKTYNEIAEIMDCPLGTVQSRLSRARHELRIKVLRKLGGIEK